MQQTDLLYQTQPASDSLEAIMSDLHALLNDEGLTSLFSNEELTALMNGSNLYDLPVSSPFEIKSFDEITAPFMREPVPQVKPEVIIDQFRAPAPPETPETARQQLKAQIPQEKPEMTSRQFRALSKNHLKLLIRDLKEELEQLKKENEYLHAAYQTGKNAGLAYAKQQ